MKQVIIFGTGQRGEEVFDILKAIPGYEVIGFSDNDESKWNTINRGIDIIAPSDMKQKYKNAMVVIASGFYPEIWMQLHGNGWIPQGGCIDSVNRILENLSESERDALERNIKRSTRFYDFDCRENETEVSEMLDEEKCLVICNGGYPTDDNPRCAFVHRRVLRYMEAGIAVEAFGFVEGSSLRSYEYQGVKVWQGDTAGLQKVLTKRSYKKLLIHFVDEKIMYSVWKSGCINKQMLIWGHGYEVLPWTRTWFNYTEEEIWKRKEQWNQRDCAKKEFLQKIFAMNNVEFVFVSNWLKNRVKKFVGSYPLHYTVVPNFMDTAFYASADKKEEDRLHVLSIKNHKTRMYGNDMTAKAILELSQKPFFQYLSFHLYGDGDLFQDNFGELMKREFSNVFFYKRFMNQNEMKQLFNENGIFLSPTRMDSHQVTSGEAMAAGMAVITSNIGPMHEFMDEECASLFECENYFMMAEEIEYLYYHPEEFLKKSRNAKERAERQCGYSSTIKKEIDLIVS